ncbi:LacI family DNA-binding transcriptional regulator [Ileibacterium valens]|uniref:Uncharacterized protein n=1 Tax=Ileibacterium valens TaxID=1862668 RepID=A0A1U7NG66_9FIRM|nr:LacI family DNA-binding transcriptional regulator [Ileibacterium valens]OLU36950.1 hypothetical protein BO224_11565 [Erysipelotrichaceae bacterium NYU-BL-E8]OLU39842.1 hypothetical protein BO222_06085 [Ileibacterium valens]OLU41921.1 hypothetical protein BM735_03205 [Erysipelotrichaceae bacterium NYU-BL-F16]
MRKKNSITIADIAKKAGVSRTTVSFYLNQKFEKMSGKTRKKIQDVIEETEFVPNALARSLNNKQSHLAGVLLSSSSNDRTENSAFLAGIQDEMQKHGYQIIAASAGADLEEERKAIEQMIGLNVDGLIVQPSDSFDLLWNTLKAKIPMVACNPTHASRYKCWVRSNDYEAVYDTLEKAVECGYTRFVLVSQEESRLSGMVQRIRAFDDLMQIRHLENQQIYIDDLDDQSKLEFSLISHIRIDQPTCFFVTEPKVLSMVYPILRSYRELMPDSLGVIGFDGIEWTRMVSPSVTTIVQPSYEEGVQAARIVLDQILEEDQQMPCRIFSCRLEQGETTRKLFDTVCIKKTHTKDE